VLLGFEHEGVRLEDWLTELRQGAEGPVLMKLSPSVLQREGQARTEKFIEHWVRHLAASACGVGLQARIVSRDAVLALQPLPPEVAQQALRTLLALWRQGMEAPLPLACRTALAFVTDGKPQEVYEGGGFNPVTPEGEEPCLARLYPDFETLTRDGRFQDLAPQLYGPFSEWARTAVRVLAQAGAEGGEAGDD
jgi:exodeoxyribonuclease V gamma subunit